MGEEENIFPHLAASFNDRLHPPDRFFHGNDRASDADGTADGGADVRDDRIGPSLGHGFGLIRRGDIDNREQVHLAGQGDHLEFFLHAHPGLFEHLAELAVHDSMSRKIVDAGKTHFFDLE